MIYMIVLFIRRNFNDENNFETSTTNKSQIIWGVKWWLTWMLNNIYKHFNNIILLKFLIDF